jgi:hypothetical protein
MKRMREKALCPVVVRGSTMMHIESPRSLRGESRAEEEEY